MIGFLIGAIVMTLIWCLTVFLKDRTYYEGEISGRRVSEHSGGDSSKNDYFLTVQYSEYSSSYGRYYKSSVEVKVPRDLYMKANMGDKMHVRKN